MQALDYLTADDIARALFTPPTRVRRWLAEGLIPSVVLPSGERIVARADLLRWLEARRTDGKSVA